MKRYVRSNPLSRHTVEVYEKPNRADYVKAARDLGIAAAKELGAREYVEGIARVLKLATDAIGGEVALDRVTIELSKGGQEDVERAMAIWEEERKELIGAWEYGISPSTSRPAVGWMFDAEDKVGSTLIYAFKDGLEVSRAVYSKGRTSSKFDLRFNFGTAVLYSAAVLERMTPYKPDEILQILWSALDPDAWRPVAPGVYAKSSRSGKKVSVAYAKKPEAKPFATIVYELYGDRYRRDSVVKMKIAKDQVIDRSKNVDRSLRAAIIDILSRGVRRINESCVWGVGEPRRKNFDALLLDLGFEADRLGIDPSVIIGYDISDDDASALVEREKL